MARCDQDQATLDKEDGLVRLALVQQLMAYEDTCREALKAAENAVKQAKRRLEEAELAVRCELRRMPRRKSDGTKTP